MAKRKSEASAYITGYIHDVSALKRSKNNSLYFDGKMQTGADEIRRLICFSAEKYDSCKTAASLKSPVKLGNAILSPNRGQIEVQLKSASTVEMCSQPLSFKRSLFQEEHSANDQIMSLKLADVNKNLTGQNVTSVNVKIIAIKEEIDQKECYGSTIEFGEFYIADESEQTSLTLWGDLVHKVEEGKSYKFTNLSTRLFRQEFKLTSTKKTEVTAIPDLDKVTKDTLTINPVHSIKTKLRFVSSSSLTKCGACNRVVPDQEIGNTDDDMTKCPHCSMVMENSALVSTTSMIIKINTVNSEVKRITAFHPVLKSFLHNCERMDLLHSPDKLSKFLLKLPEVVLKYSTDLITEISLPLPEKGITVALSGAADMESVLIE